MLKLDFWRQGMKFKYFLPFPWMQLLFNQGSRKKAHGYFIDFPSWVLSTFLFNSVIEHERSVVKRKEKRNLLVSAFCVKVKQFRVRVFYLIWIPFIPSRFLIFIFFPPLSFSQSDQLKTHRGGEKREHKRKPPTKSTDFHLILLDYALSVLLSLHSINTRLVRIYISLYATFKPVKFI